MEDSVKAVESILNYNFKDKKLLEEALTHPSYTDGPSYQRLEFLGDSVLGLAISTFFFSSYPDIGEGPLTDLRKANVSTERLARVAVRLGLYKHIRHNKANLSALGEKVSEFITMVEEEKDVVVHGGVMRAPKVLVDIVESVAGAVFVDCGFNSQMLWTIFRALLEPLVMLDVVLAQPQPVSALYEAHGKQLIDIQYHWNGETYTASVFVDDTFIASGSSETKEIAKLHAAEAALSKLTKSKTSDASFQTKVDFNKSTEIKDAKKILHELCDKKKLPKPTYKVEQELGPHHDKRFVSSAQVELSDQVLCVKGNERSRLKDAENSAASMMLCILQK
ncbi:ribonuclease 3-like protein 2 [Bidens hawaiensis]|uniref:ribonuclease 3-like protein 2 n=1 Tax=Bidens hawaiensis TaxID=980011 RepID=UPI004049BA6E